MSTNYVPAMQARMGDWIYYITKMKFGDVSRDIQFANEIHPTKDLDDAIQRDISNRVEDMKQFLLTEPQRFYGALVVAVYKGNPIFRPVRIDENHELVDSVHHSFGLLQLDGSQTFFALDGQHRVSSIKEACNENYDLKDEEITVIVLHHDNTKDGLVRTRRLFTKLNRYAKATDEKTNITIDEDDAIAILTRLMIKEYDGMDEIVKIETASKQIGKSQKDNKYLITMRGLYEINELIMDFYDPNIVIDNKFKGKRPDDDELEKMYSHLEMIWNKVFDRIPLLKQIKEKKVFPGHVRNHDNGGSIWVRTNALMIFFEVLKGGVNLGGDVDHIIDSFIKISSDINEEPWVNVIFDSNRGAIIGTKKEREFLVAICMYMIGLKSYRKVSELEDLYNKYNKFETRKKIKKVV